LILLTTSDYFPQIGGLSTFTQNIESVLNELKLDYKLLHWKSYKEIQNISERELSQYSLIINIHPQFSWLAKSHHEQMINFIHGSEIMMTSPNIIKKIYKKINKHNYFNKLQKSYLNIFISEATLSKACTEGFSIDYSRDLILHNCIDVKDAQFIKKEIRNKLSFSCIVRNVTHKNLSGSQKFCELVAEVTGREVELIVPKDSKIASAKITIKELNSAENNERDKAYKASHYNLLLSLDHSHKGFFEGFGLTVLEAARFGTPSIVMNTGGLPEAVHHGETGWVIDKVSKESIKEIFSRENESKYYQMAIDCYSHTTRSHSLNEYAKLIEIVSMQRGVA
jgi:glycosyltransferase involved in cell wall biosynthesis